VVRRALHLVGSARAAADAALMLGTAEAALSRRALPHVIGWFCAALVFGMSLGATLWVTALFGLRQWLGSMPLALTLLGIVSALALGGAVIVLRRLLRWASFPQTRLRLALLLQRMGYGVAGDADRRPQ
jgi:hypothetical protein